MLDVGSFQIQIGDIGNTTGTVHDPVGIDGLSFALMGKGDLQALF